MICIIVKREATSGRKCANGCRIRTCEKYWQVVNATTGKDVRGERYCVHCEKYARMNNVIQDTPEGTTFDRETGLYKVPGENRPFAMTARGLRAGREHTGMPCEDAPCCGCC